MGTLASRPLGRISVLLPVLLAVAVGSVAVRAQAPLDEEVARLVDEVAGLRGIEPEGPIPYRLLGSDDALAGRLEPDPDDPSLIARAEAEAELLVRLGLVEPGTDVLALIRDALASQIAGYYDTDTRSLTVIDADGELDAVARLTLAHEVQHALQDQRWGLDRLLEATGDDADRASALTALVEGDATVVMTLWALRNALGDLTSDMTIPELGEDEALMRLPPILLRQLLFPYVDGTTFVMSRWGPGGWQAIDAIWDDPPVSSEQVMHPERYPDDVPSPVDIGDPAARLGPGWSVASELVLGEVGTGVWVADGAEWDPMSFSLAGVQLPRAEAAEGWDGDRAVLLEGPDGTWAVLWQTAWDGEADAAEFAAAAEDAMDDLPGAHEVLPGAVAGADIPSPVLVLVADGPATLGTVREALGV
jgi:hypothetical protein